MSRMWNFGVLLTMTLGAQIMTGLMLGMVYTPEIPVSNLLNWLEMDLKQGWSFRSSHVSGASVMFILMYMHMYRNLKQSSYMNKKVWVSGSFLYLLTMMVSFFGYVLPWGQMSFWGATVITSLATVIPSYGEYITWLLWGNFSVSDVTLSRFYVFHYLFALTFIPLMTTHLYFLHLTGSSNPLGASASPLKISFYPLLMMMDLEAILTLLIFMFILVNLGLLTLFEEFENFNEADPMMAPLHIQPEWYFLYVYAILRCIPNKIGGVMMLVLSILVMFIMVLTKKKKKSAFINVNNMLPLMLFVMMMLTLSWCGAMEVASPFTETSLTAGFFFFSITKYKVNIKN